MISDPVVARRISDLMLEFGARLDISVAEVSEQCGREELAAYRRAVGSVMSTMLLDIMNPLYAKHPAIKPSGIE